MFHRINRFFRNKLPKTIYYRFLLIVLLPLLFTQVIFFYIFFNRYWKYTSKQNINTLITDIIIINKRYDELFNYKKSNIDIIKDINIFSDIKVYFVEGKKLNNVLNYNNNDYDFIYNPIRQLKNELYILNFGRINFYNNKDNYYNIEIEKNNGILLLEIRKNRIFISRVDLIVFWNIFSFIIIGGISLLFLRNQVRSIEKLKNFANDFSYLEKDNTLFKPTGAKEIREMGNSFINVVHKMKQMINSRTTMLAQISHDLRTPLTRMKLQTEFIEDENISKYFKADLEEMEKMINEYLLFAKGEAGDKFRRVNIRNFFDIIVSDYKRSGYNIDINYNLNQRTVILKEDHFKRCINNLINNALKYYKKCIKITVFTLRNHMVINVEDDGCGVCKELVDKIKTPFYSIDKKNNIGLGLSIVQNIVNMHKGKMFLKSSNLGGLNVELIIPLRDSL